MPGGVGLFSCNRPSSILPGMRPLTICLALAFLCVSLPAYPHGGGLDAYGCHHNRVHGGYHCHRGQFAGQSFASQGEMLASRQQSYTAVPPFLPTLQFSGKVVGVSDGDTITVLAKGKPERIRLHGIDCPEKRQAFGKRAKQATSRLVYGKTVTVRDLGQDRYGRTVGEVMLPDGRSLNHELVKAGYAWWCRRYAPEDETLKQLEQEARGGEAGVVGGCPVGAASTASMSAPDGCIDRTLWREKEDRRLLMRGDTPLTIYYPALSPDRYEILLSPVAAIEGTDGGPVSQ